MFVRVLSASQSAVKPLFRFNTSKNISKLYYTPTSCGAASFIAAFTANVKLECEQVNLGTHVTASGVDFYKINSKGNVPCLVLDDGTVLNENAAVLQYIADQAAGTIAPVSGTPKAVLQNTLSFIASEVHPSIGGLFNPKLGEETRAYIRGNATRKLEYLEKNLLGDDRKYLVDGAFSIADCYLYIVLTWTKYVKVDLTPYPKVQAYLKRIGELDNVKGAFARIATSPKTTV